MMCYMDMTFCPFHEECLSGKDCHRALTKQVKKEAAMWWGGDDAPIMMFVDKPWCFEAKMEEPNDE